MSELPATKFLFDDSCPKVTLVELTSLRLLNVRTPPPLTVRALSLEPVGNTMMKVSRLLMMSVRVTMKRRETGWLTNMVVVGVIVRVILFGWRPDAVA